MENLNMALVSSTSPKLVLNYTNFKHPTRGITGPRRSSSLALPFKLSTSRISASVRAGPYQNGQVGAGGFASLTSSSGQQTSSVGVNPNLPMPPPSSNVGSPLFWVGVGVGLSALFSFVASRLKQYAMQQALKGMMNQMNTQNKPFGNAAFPQGSPFPFPNPPASGPTTPYPAASQPRFTMDIPATKVEAASATDVEGKKEVKGETEVKEEPKKYDVSPEETLQKSPFDNFEDVKETSSSKDAQPPKDSQNGAAFNYNAGSPFGGQSASRCYTLGTITDNYELVSVLWEKEGRFLTVDTLEKLMEDPQVQKMVYPSLPEEMRNPASFKLMLQNPEYRKQLQEMLDGMCESGEFDGRVLDSLKNFDLNSAEVKQQFEQIGLTPEEVITKMMANPEIALGFQSPRVQAAIMECSQNPMNIIKYQNDKEVFSDFV
ncbi:protein TIC 40 [Citrus sinensis]|uniref:Protein TIC 40 n=2 Tax=Citrus sinensis TaxID=2711 RepID=A0ACB8K263_CITSI|nr:protein TIC 40 [Citrus sinensis]